MANLVDKILINIDKGLYNNILSNEDLIQIIEQCGMHLNLKTISNYAKDNNISYNGAKNIYDWFFYSAFLGTCIN